MRALVLFALLTSAGCLRKTEYKCSENTQCGAGGQCEADVGYCSFPDSMCASGRRYADLASSTYSGKCVGDVVVDQDSGIDTPDNGDGGVDSMTDGGGGGCPGTYTTTIGTHKYRVISTGAVWSAQVAACAADGSNAYLAMPDDQTELTAIIAASGAALTWVGIDDQTTEGTYVKVTGGTVSSSSPLWDTNNNEPDNMPSSGGGQADCVNAVMSENRLADDKCGSAFPAVCECEP